MKTSKSTRTNAIAFTVAVLLAAGAACAGSGSHEGGKPSGRLVHSTLEFIGIPRDSVEITFSDIRRIPREVRYEYGGRYYYYLTTRSRRGGRSAKSAFTVLLDGNYRVCECLYGHKTI